MTDHRGNEEELDKEVRRSEDAVGCDLLILEKIPADMLEYALRFMYTDSCELLVHGARPRASGVPTAQNQVAYFSHKISNVFNILLVNTYEMKFRGTKCCDNHV